MHWLHYLSWFFGGAFLANALPHYVSGLMGRPFQSPFAHPARPGTVVVDSQRTVGIPQSCHRLCPGLPRRRLRSAIQRGRYGAGPRRPAARRGDGAAVRAVQRWQYADRRMTETSLGLPDISRLEHHASAGVFGRNICGIRSPTCQPWPRHDSFAGNPAQAAIFAAKFAAHFCALHSRAAISIARHFPSNKRKRGRNRSRCQDQGDTESCPKANLACWLSNGAGAEIEPCSIGPSLERSSIHSNLMHVELDPVGMPRADADEQVLHQPAVVRGTGLESRH